MSKKTPLLRLCYRVSEEKLLPHVAMVAKFLDLNTPWSRKYGRKKKRKNWHVWLSCTWLKSGTKQPIIFFHRSTMQMTVLIKNDYWDPQLCYLGNVTSKFPSLNKLIKCRVALVVNCNLFHFSHYTLFSCTYYVHWQWTPVFQTHAITVARAFWEMKAALCAAVPQSFRGQHVKASLTRIKSR